MHNSERVKKDYPAVTNSMVQDILWKVIGFSAFQRIACFLCGTQCFVHYHVHKSSPLDSILNQLNPVCPINLYLPKVHLNVILPPTSWSSQWSLPFRPPNQNPVNTSPIPHAYHMSCPPHLPWFNHPDNIRWTIQAMELIIMQFSPWSILLPFMSKYPPQHPVLKNPQSVFLPQNNTN